MIKRIVSLTGMNRAIGFSLFTRGWQVIAGPVSILLVTKFFSVEEQGFYYTFSSILALQVLFELGLAFVIMQFASHEFASLSWGEGGQVIGVERAVARFYAIIERSIVWYGWVALMLIALILPFGLYFFSSQSGQVPLVSWRYSWSLLVFSAAMYVPLIPVLAVIEGSGEVARVNKLRLIQIATSNVATWIAIASGAGLFSAATVFIVNTIVGYSWVARNYPVLLAELRQKWGRTAGHFDWMHEVWPMQWRIAVSWISGYVIFQMFTPILFHYQGPAVAGRMGISLAIANMTITFAQAWLQTSTPRMAKAVAQKNWYELDKIFGRVFWQSTGVVCIGSILVLAVLWYLARFPLGQRFLPPEDMAYLLMAFALTHVIGAFAYYLRVHKQEPFMLLSVIGAVLVGSSVWFFGRTYGSTGMVSSLLVINMVYGLPGALWLWMHLRKIWHQPGVGSNE
jgi:hypothetical protein